MKTTNKKTGIVSVLSNKISNLLFILILVTITTFTMNAQNNGTIKGVIVDADFGDALIGANVMIDGTTKGAAADINGIYSITEVEAGTYSITFSMVGFQKKTVTGVEIKANETTKIDIVLGTETYETEEVVIAAKAINNTEASLLAKRQKSVAVSDAISSEQFSKSGASNAADAVKQVVGASVVDGKYVYVRGLGDRYTSTQLNGAEIPSIDPYKRAGSIDLIPSNLIDNIQAVKTFTPDKQGNFSGGSVDISTKDFPDNLKLSVGISSSYNSQISLNENGFGSTGSSTDWLGMDNGSRDLSNLISGETYLARVGEAQTNDKLAGDIDKITKSFSTEMAPTSRTIPVNQSYSLSVGNQFEFLGKPLGYLFSLSYKRNQSGYFNGELNRWSRGVADQSKTQLDATFNMNDTKSVDNVLWGGVAKLSYKFSPDHIISLNGLYNQNGQNSSRFISGSYPYDQDPSWLYQARSIQYKERALISFQLSGEHQFDDIFGIKLDWQASQLNSSQNEPDLRFLYNYVTDKNVYGIKSNLAPERFYRNTKEDKNEYNLNITLPFKQWNDESAKLKMGGFYSDKFREFKERRFVYSPANRLGVYLRQSEGDFNQLFSNEYLGWTSTDTLGNGNTLNRIPVYIQETDQTSSNYNANNKISAAYAMLDIPIVKYVRFIGGARYETTDMNVESFKEGQKGGKINTSDILPSANLIYSPYSDMNIRASFSKTLARPNFREVSPFTNYDFNGGDVYFGNPDLKRTIISNYDLRWEWYTRPGEVFSVSFFMKEFKDPIEVKILDAVNNVLSWTNVDNANVKGIELEARTKLDFVTETLSNFSVGGNLSLIASQVDIDAEEFESIKLYEPNAENTRPFQGQSPYIVNLNLNYEHPESNLNASLFYNVFGKRLSAVGSVGAPDVYEEAFHLLNFSLSKGLFTNLKLKLSANNILNSRTEKTQEFKGNRYVYTAYSTGRTFSISLGYNL